ncbi:MAG: ATP-binding protein [Clostridiales bacterium]
MDLNRLSHKFSDITNINILSKLLFILIAGILMTFGFYATIWKENIDILYTVFEFFCIFISLAIFFVVWYNYKYNTIISYFFGFGFLLVTIFEAFHIYYYYNFTDLSVEFWILGRIIESIVILLVSFRIWNIKMNRWLGLIITIIFAYTMSNILVNYPISLMNVDLFTVKTISSILIIIILMISVIKLRKEINIKSQITYNYIFLALIVAIIVQVIFVIFFDNKTFLSLLMNILKIIYYALLFNGIFVSAVRYPYDKLDDERKYMNEILNTLPIGLTTYNENLKLLFANNKGKELLDCNMDDVEKNMENVIEKFCGSRKTDKNLIRMAVEKSSSIKDKMITLNNNGNLNIKIIVNVLKLKDKGYICMFDEAKKEQELENLRLQTQTILNCLSNTVLIMDNNKKIIMCNKAFKEVYEVRFSEIVGMSINEFNNMFELEKREIEEESSKEDNNMYELTIITKNENKKELIVQPAHIYNVDGEIIGDISVGSDITELKREQEKLLHKDKLALLGQMSAAIVHESKNLLASIKGYCQLIILKEQDLQIKKYVGRIDNMTDEVNKVMVDFLDMAKPRSPILKETSLNEMIKSMEFMLSSSSLIKGVDISIILSPTEKMVMCDESQLRQVILNMVKNSIEAMSKIDNPVLIIKTGQIKDNSDKDEMYVDICDNGKGISETEKIKIGSPFFTTKKNGTGLGLNVCYQIIKEHNGRIDLDSESGKGTTFKVILPSIDDDLNHKDDGLESDYLNDNMGNI